MSALRICSSLAALPLVLGLFCLSCPVRGGEKDKASGQEKEAAEAAAEEEAEKKLDEMDSKRSVTLTGRFSRDALAPEDTPPGVVGVFSATDGNLYLVKLADQGMLKLLCSYDKKDVTLAGKLRNKGKYLIVETVIAGEPKPLPRVKRVGI